MLRTFFKIDPELRYRSMPSSLGGQRRLTLALSAYARAYVSPGREHTSTLLWGDIGGKREDGSAAAYWPPRTPEEGPSQLAGAVRLNGVPGSCGDEALSVEDRDGPLGRLAE